MLTCAETKLAKEKFYGTKKKPINIQDVNVDNTVISKLVETTTNSKYLTGYLLKVTRPLVLVLPKMSGYIKRQTIKDEGKEKNMKLTLFCINDEKLLEKYKTIWIKTED